VAYDLGTLTRTALHTIRFWMRLVPGPDNDLVRISIDGQDVGQCFTTWENFYRATNQQVPISDRLLFLSGNRDGDRPSLLGRLPPIVKKADSSTVRAGGLAGYQIR
jgi:hypothetical protein